MLNPGEEYKEPRIIVSDGSIPKMAKLHYAYCPNRRIRRKRNRQFGFFLNGEVTDYLPHGMSKIKIVAKNFDVKPICNVRFKIGTNVRLKDGMRDIL